MVEKLLEYQEVDRSLKSIEEELRKSDEFKKYAQAVKFLKTVTESKAQIESKATSLLSSMQALEAKLKQLNEDKNEFGEIKDIDAELKPYFDELGLDFPFEVEGK